MKIVGIGHSHLHCVRHAYDVWRSPLNAAGVFIDFVDLGDPKFSPFRVPDALNGIDGFAFCDDLHAAIVEATPSADLLFMCVGGNAYNMFGLVRHPQPFDFVLPSEPELGLERDFEPIPWQLMLEAFRRSDNFQLNTWFFKALKALCGSALTHQYSSPPPLPSSHVVARPGIFEAALNEHGVNPLSVRYKLWKVEEILTTAECNTLGVEFMAPPPAIVAGLDHLPAEFSAGDATHANHLYGRAVIEQLVRIKNPNFVFPTPE